MRSGTIALVYCLCHVCGAYGRFCLYTKERVFGGLIGDFQVHLDMPRQFSVYTPDPKAKLGRHKYKVISLSVLNLLR